MRTTDGFAEALVDSSSVDGNELDAWLQRYQFLRSSLYGVAEPPAEYVVVRPRGPHVVHDPDLKA
jgi:hypothetical protein